MSYEVLGWILLCGFFACWVVWGILLLAMTYHLIKKNFPAFRISLLITLNTLLFIAGWGYVVKLAMIVNFRELDTYEASVAELKRRGIEYFWNFTWWTLFFVVVLGVFNYLYLRFIHKKVEWKLMMKLAIGELVFLLLCAWLAVQDYYTGLMGEINMHFGLH